MIKVIYNPKKDSNALAAAALANRLAYDRGLPIREFREYHGGVAAPCGKEFEIVAAQAGLKPVKVLELFERV